MALEEVHGPQVTQQSGYRNALVATSVALNAAWAAFAARQVVGSDQHGVIDVVFGVYDLDSRLVRLPLAATSPFSTGEMGLFPAPTEPEEFRRLAHSVCGGGHVESLLGSRS